MYSRSGKAVMGGRVRLPSAVPQGSPGQINVLAGPIQASLVHQGAIVPNREPQLLGYIQRRRRLLKTSKPLLRTRGWLKGFKRRFKQMSDTFPSDLPGDQRVELPSYAQDVERIAGVPYPQYPRKAAKSIKGRDRYGFLQTHFQVDVP